MYVCIYVYTRNYISSNQSCLTRQVVACASDYRNGLGICGMCHMYSTNVTTVCNFIKLKRRVAYHYYCDVLLLNMASMLCCGIRPYGVYSVTS